MHVMRLQNRVAIITGASSGIGRSAAFALAKRGCHLVLASRNEAKLSELERELQNFRNGVVSIPADITRLDDIRELIKKTLEHFARIDFLICSAGKYLRSPSHATTVEDIQSIFEINFYGTLNCIRETLPHMLARRSGHIIVISSLDGKKGLPPDAAYVASKFALSGYIEVMRQEFKSLGINFSTIFPARVDTPMISNLTVPWISPKIPPERVARAIIRAIIRKRPEVVVPLLGPKLLITINHISPTLGDWLIKYFKLSGQNKMTETSE